MMIKSGTIPLQHGELRIMKPAYFALPESFADLENSAAAGRKQPLHCIFRRCLQIIPLLFFMRLGLKQCGYALNECISDRCMAHERCFNFHDTPGGKKITNRFDDTRSCMKRLDRGRWPP